MYSRKQQDNNNNKKDWTKNKTNQQKPVIAGDNRPVMCCLDLIWAHRLTVYVSLCPKQKQRNSLLVSFLK